MNQRATARPRTDETAKMLRLEAEHATRLDQIIVVNVEASATNHCF
jgi:hypothetical protein